MELQRSFSTPRYILSLSLLKRANNNKELIELWSNFLFKVYRACFEGMHTKSWTLKQQQRQLSNLSFFSHIFAALEDCKIFLFSLCHSLCLGGAFLSQFSLFESSLVLVIYITYTANENADKQHSQEIKMSTEKCRKRNFICCCLCVSERVARKEENRHMMPSYTTLFMIHNFSWIKQQKARWNEQKKSLLTFFSSFFLSSSSSLKAAHTYTIPHSKNLLMNTEKTFTIFFLLSSV